MSAQPEPTLPQMLEAIRSVISREERGLKRAVEAGRLSQAFADRQMRLYRGIEANLARQAGETRS